MVYVEIPVEGVEIGWQVGVWVVYDMGMIYLFSRTMKLYTYTARAVFFSTTNHTCTGTR